MRSRLFAALALLAIAAPAAAQHTRLVRASELVDSVRLDALLRERAAAGVAGEVVLSIAIDSTGTPGATRVFSGKLPEPELRALVEGVAPLVRPQARTTDRWWIRLVLHVSSQPTFRTRRSVEEPPRLMNPEALDEAIRTGQARPERGGNGIADLRLLVGSDGVVRGISTHISTLALPAPTLQRLIQKLHFTPGKIDDQAETLWLDLRYIAGTGGLR